MDDMLYPVYTTAKARSRTYNFNETGDAMIRELDLSKITLRMVTDTDRNADEIEKDEDVKCKLVGNTAEVLKRCLYTPTQLSLKDSQGRESKVTVSLKYLPVRMQLDPSESFNNSGNLRVEVLDAADLPAADRNGYSDPFCKFKLNGENVYKTKTQKKTLHPAWNEFFEVPVRSRTAAKFQVTVYDWDFGDKADYLGAATIDLGVLEPFQAQEVTLGLDGKSGALRLKMLFRPDYVTRSRQGSSTFSGTFSTPGKVIGAPVKGVGKGAMLVGGGVAKGAGFLGRGFKRRTVSQAAESPQESNGTMGEMHETTMDVPSSPNGHVTNQSMDGINNKELPSTPGTPHKRMASFGGASQLPAADSGMATISVLGASGFEGDTRLEVRILHDSTRGLKEICKTKAVKTKTGEVTYEDESKKVPCTADSQFKVFVRDHHTFGGSSDLGEQAFFINDQSSGSQREIKVGTGVVVVRTSFQPAEAGSVMGADSPKNKSLGRFMSRRERSVTPSAG